VSRHPEWNTFGKHEVFCAYRDGVAMNVFGCSCIKFQVSYDLASVVLRLAKWFSGVGRFDFGQFIGILQ